MSMRSARMKIAPPGLLVAAAWLLFAGAPVADAITAKEADKLAIKTLKAKKQGDGVALLAEPKALRKGAVIAEGGVQGALPSGPTELRGTKLKSKAYLFWLDREYGAEFEHPSTILLLDAKSGKAIKRQDMLWWPIVDGSPPAYLASSHGYASKQFQVYSGRPRVDAPPERPALRHRASARLPAGTFANDCMVMLGDRGSPTFGGSFTAMKKWADKAGVTSSNAATKEELPIDIADFIGHGCKDVFIYIAGHGVPPPGWVASNGVKQTGGPAAVELGSKYVFDKGSSKTAFTPQTLTPEELDQILKGFGAGSPGVEFKLKIDACFAGRFKALKANPNLRVLELSSGENQTSQGFLGHYEVKEKDGKVVKWITVADNPDGATEFTNGDIHGLNAWGDSATEMSQYPGLAGAIQRSLTLGKDYNLTIGTIPVGEPGHTDPEVYTNPPISLTPPPLVSPVAPTGAFAFLPNSPPASPKAGQTVSFDGSASSDPDGSIAAWAWQFGAPLFAGGGSASVASATGVMPSASFSGPGVYPVTLTVTDDGGHAASPVTHNVFVSGPGSKVDALTDVDCMAASGVEDINVPTYAQSPTASLTAALSGCGAKSITNVMVTFVPGSVPPNPIDAWGQPENHVHITYDFVGPNTAATGSATFTATWN
jgi:PKD repeat protein